MQKQSKPKHIPQRTCIACRRNEGKRSFIRLVRTVDGVEIDVTGKKAGRGAYLCTSQQCWQIALRSNRIEQALRTKLSLENRKKLAEYGASLPEKETESEAIVPEKIVLEKSVEDKITITISSLN